MRYRMFTRKLNENSFLRNRINEYYGATFVEITEDRSVLVQKESDVQEAANKNDT